MKKITNVGIDIPSNGEGYIKLDSKSSLSESDISIFCPDFSNTSYSSDYSSGSGTYEGNKLYDKNSSAKIIEHSKHWENEILNFVGNGGTLFFILNKKVEFYIYSGQKSFSGTGKNQQTTNQVMSFTNYKLLPISKIEFNSASGKIVIPTNAMFNEFHNNLKDYITYETYLKGESIANPTFTTKNKDRILGNILKIKKGHIVFLPNLNLSPSNFTTYNPKTEKENWTEEALKVGKIFINSVLEIDKILKKNIEKTPKPSWLYDQEFKLKKSEITEKKIVANELIISKKNTENENLKTVLDEQESLKDLLYETGKPLEEAVIKALKIIGYEAENFDDWELELDQIIVSPEGDRFIGECEGKDSKDIDVTKFRQLLDGLNADFEKETVNEKAYGLLIGNPQRLISPNQRTLSFTSKCQSGANREKIGLIKTADLFNICKIIEENKSIEFAKKCRMSIL